MSRKTGTSPLAAGGPGRYARFGGGAKRVFFVLFAAVFGLMFLQVVFNQMHVDYQPLPTLLAAALWAGAFFGLYRLCRRFCAFLEKRERWCLLGFGLLLAATQLWFYWQAANTPIVDIGYVYEAATHYAIGGYMVDPQLSYLCLYPNNMPLTIVLQFLFRVGLKLGFTDFYLIAVFFNVLCYWATYLFVYLSCRRLFGVARGFFAIGLLYLCIPLHVFLTCFYTDTTSMPFVAMGFYLYLRFRDAKTMKGRVLALGLMTLALALGSKLKYSVAILMIAIVVDLLLRGEWKRLLAAALAFVCGYLLVATALDSYMYTMLPRERVQEESHPFNGWIMMGLAGDGAVNSTDNFYVWAWPTKAERIQKTNEEIVRRLQAYGPGGYLLFLNQKGIRSWGDGTLDLGIWVFPSIHRDSLMLYLLNPGESGYPVFRYVLQGYHVALFALLIAGAVAAARRKNYVVFVPYLATLGLYLFLLLWEAAHRYLINYFSMYMVAAAFSAGMLFEREKKMTAAAEADAALPLGLEVEEAEGAAPKAKIPEGGADGESKA